MKWPEAVVFAAFWLALALAISSMASCQARSTEAHEKSCETKSFCIG